MAEEKNTKTAAPTAEAQKAETQKVGTNPLTIPWPSDPQGALQDLKRGGVKAANRVNGDKEKLKKLVETLRRIEAHAKAKYVKDADARKVARENAISARARVAERQAREAEARAKEYEAAAERVRKAAGVTNQEG